MSNCSLIETLTYLKSNYSTFFVNCMGKIRCKPRSLKDYLCNYVYFKAENNIITFEPQPEDLKKLKNALFMDFEYFYSKSMIQYADYLLQTHSSKTWKIVTYYYFLFFCVTTLFRYTGHGCLYFTDEEIKQIKNKLISEEKPSLSKGLYEYQLIKTENSIKIQVEKDKSGHAIHEKTWHMFYHILSDFINNVTPKSMESLLLNAIKNLFDKYSKNYPSYIRNIYNYQGIYAVDELQNNIPCILHHKLNNLHQLRPQNKDNNAIKAQSLIYIGIFLNKLIQDLHKDVLSRISPSPNEINELQNIYNANHPCDLNTLENLFK